MASTLFDALGSEWFCVTAVRGLREADVLARLGADGSKPPVRCRIDGSYDAFDPDIRAVRIHCPPGAGWAYVFDAFPQIGVVFQRPVLRRLSAGTEAVSVWQLIAGTTRVAHVRDGEVLALFDAGRFEPASGPEPHRLNRALERAGFFEEDEERIDDEFSDPAAALEAVEREFGLGVDPQAVAGPLPSVIVAVRAD